MHDHSIHRVRPDADHRVRDRNIEPEDENRVCAEERESGLLERDRVTGRVLGLEYWQAGKRLPAELLDALAGPPPQHVVVERQPAA